MGYKIQKNIFWVHIRVLWSSFPLHWKPNILSLHYDSWWQRQMSVRELKHDKPSGWFSKSRGLSASVSFLSSPPPPRSFTCAIFRAVFDSRSSFSAPKPHGNACYAGYFSCGLWLSFLVLNRTETLATQAMILWIANVERCELNVEIEFQAVMKVGDSR